MENRLDSSIEVALACQAQKDYAQVSWRQVWSVLGRYRVMLSRRMTIFLAVVTGISLELGIHALSGRREAWDSAQYWTIGLPIAFLISVALGFLSQRSNWLWTFAI